MRDDSVDILMITYNRPEYTRLALGRLLESCDDSMRVWIWHNGTDEETLEVSRALSRHPAVHRFHHSPRNERLRVPTNWLFENAEGAYLSKVDDDCLLPDGWAQTLRKAHVDVPELGVIGCWRFLDEDFLPDVAGRKIEEFPGGHRIMLNCWVEGSGYLMKRECLERQGPLTARDSFTTYCVRHARAGWKNGWYFPFIYQEHMDDPRTPHTLLRSDSDLERFMPLSARQSGVRTLKQWEDQLRSSARFLQHAAPDARQYSGWRRAIRGAGRRLGLLLGKSQA